MTIPVSACIICKNEARRIAGALDSLSWCEDIVVVDSGSTDGTVQIARGHRAHPRVLHQDWLGYNPQREFAVSQCKHEWVLMLDADEECDERLIAEVRGLTEPQTAGVAIFRMPRKNYVAGRHVICWGPDYQSRLIHRDRVEWDQTSAPEIRRPKAGFGEKKLRGHLLHNRVAPFRMVDISDGPRMEENAAVLAASMAAKGKRAGYWNILLRPAMAFVKYYVFKGAFLQGRFGLVIAHKTMIGVMLKYSVLYAMQELEDRREKREG